jgi:choline-sulfatase
MAANRMSRRGFLRGAGAGAAALAAGAPGVLSGRRLGTRPARKPNLLVILSDEHNAGVLGASGSRIARTPNLDSLSRRGVTFESCYCNSPLCVPSRLSFASGKYVSRVGAWSNSCWLPSADYPTIARLLNAAGYESLLCGKMHFDRSRRYGFREIGGNMNRSHKTGRGGRRRAENLTPKPGLSNRFKDFHVGESRILTHDRAVTAGTIDLLRRRKASDKPFFLIAGYLAPHFPLIVPERYWQPYKGNVPMPRIPAEHLEAQPLNYKHLRIGFNVEDAPAGIVRKGRELYHGLTQWLDVEIGKVLSALGKSEVADETVVVYTSDHGENMGEHGLWWKNCMYEHASRVPLIVSWPARWKGGQRRARACSLVDLTQTLVALAGARAPDDWNGDSMLAWLGDPQSKWKDLAVSQYYAHNIASGFAMLRRERYKYVYHVPPDARHPAERELYDLRADPGEFTNLAGRAEHADRVQAMHAALVRELGEHPDETEKRCRADCAKGYARGARKKQPKRNRAGAGGGGAA